MDRKDDSRNCAATCYGGHRDCPLHGYSLNFASSPARILIDFLDPIMVAEKIAITESYKYITMDDIASEIRDGKKGIDGIGSNGKMTKKFTIN